MMLGELALLGGLVAAQLPGFAPRFVPAAEPTPAASANATIGLPDPPSGAAPAATKIITTPTAPAARDALPSSSSTASAVGVLPPDLLASLLAGRLKLRPTGQPMTLAACLAAVPERKDQLEATHAYWRLVRALADYYLAWDAAQEIERLTPSEHDATLLRTAQAASNAALGQAETRLLAAQYDLAAMLASPVEAPLPLPSDPPHIGPYRTNFDQLFAARVPPVRARLIDQTLPLRRRAIDIQAMAVQAAADNRLDLSKARNRGRAELGAVVAAIEEVRKQGEQFVALVCRYNDDIADYAMGVASPGATSDLLVNMLIGSNRAGVRTISYEETSPTTSTAPAAPLGGLQPLKGGVVELTPPGDVPTPAIPAPAVPTTAAPPEKPVSRSDVERAFAMPANTRPAATPFGANTPTPAKIDPPAALAPAFAAPASPTSAPSPAAISPVAPAAAALSEPATPMIEAAPAVIRTLPTGPARPMAPPLELPPATFGSRPLHRAEPPAPNASEAPRWTPPAAPVEPSQPRRVEKPTAAADSSTAPSQRLAGEKSATMPQSLYPALVGLTPVARARELTSVLHWDRGLLKSPGRALPLTDALGAASADRRAAVINAYWLARQRMAEYQAAAELAEIVRVLPSEEAGRSGANAALRTAQAAAEASQIEAEAALLEVRFQLARSLGTENEFPWPLPSTTPHGGSYSLKADGMSADLARLPEVRRGLALIPGQAENVQRLARAVIEADLHRAARTAIYESGGGSLAEVLQAVQMQSDRTRDFLAALTEYNQSIARYVLAVAPPSTRVEVLAASLVANLRSE